jgi:uncharacterized membrane protein YdbT with pleckstrin-like domain
MSFIEKNLANNERIVYTAKLHWSIYLKGILLIIIGIIAYVLSKGNIGIAAIGGLLALSGIISLITSSTRSASSEFVVTNRRIMLKTGVLKRQFTELQLNRSEGLIIDQGIMGRIFNYGSLFITSGGAREEFYPIADPYEFKRQINNAIEDSFSTIRNPSMI